MYVKVEGANFKFLFEIYENNNDQKTMASLVVQKFCFYANVRNSSLYSNILAVREKSTLVISVFRFLFAI